MGTHSSTLAWKIPWTEEPGRLQAYRVRHDWATSLSTASESKDILDERRHMGDYSPCRAWRPLLSFLNGVQLLYNVAFVSAIIKMNQLYVHTHLPTSPPSPSRSSQSTKLSSLHRTSCVFYTWQWRRFKTKRWMWRLMPPEPSRICHLGSTTHSYFSRLRATAPDTWDSGAQAATRGHFWNGRWQNQPWRRGPGTTEQPGYPSDLGAL